MRYSGKLGIAAQTETSPGVWEETITEKDVLGTVQQRSEVLTQADQVLPQYTTTTSISLLRRDVDNSMLRYITYLGKRWETNNIVSQYPEIVIYLTKEYHGPLPS